jgi:hypothetical protein
MWMKRKLAAPTLLFLLVSFGAANGACPRYRSDPAFLADLQKPDFFQRLAYDGRPPTPEQREKQKALLTAKSTDEIAELANLEDMWRFISRTPFPFTLTVAAPYQFSFNPSRYWSGAAEPLKIEFDADGDGKPEIVWQQGQSPRNFPYTYTREGDYAFTTKSYKGNGKIVVNKLRLKIVSLAALDAKLKEIWKDMRDALRRRDTGAALECFHTRSRQRYEEVFRLIPDLDKKVDEILPHPLSLVENKGNAFLYELSRDKRSFEVRFEMDSDLEWRIRSF